MWFWKRKPKHEHKWTAWSDMRTITLDYTKGSIFSSISHERNTFLFQQARTCISCNMKEIRLLDICGKKVDDITDALV